LVRGQSEAKLRQLVFGLRRDRTRIINWKDAPLMGIHYAAAAAAKSSGFSPSFLFIIVLVFIGFYFLMIRPQRRRQQQVQQQQKTVEPGARVRTTAGMYATVIEVDGDDVVLEVAPGIDVRYLRRAIMEVITPADASETFEDTEAFEDAEPDEDTETVEDGDAGTHDTGNGVGPVDEGLADSHDDDLAKSDKDTVF
jgi:preprotein translocase subunit YajC